MLMCKSAPTELFLFLQHAILRWTVIPKQIITQMSSWRQWSSLNILQGRQNVATYQPPICPSMYLLLGCEWFICTTACVASSAYVWDPLLCASWMKIKEGQIYCPCVPLIEQEESHCPHSQSAVLWELYGHRVSANKYFLTKKRVRFQ